jgi:superfamily II DNA or RNA helicase
MTKPTVTGNIVAHWFKLTYDMPTIAFCASVKASEILAQAFQDAGVAAVHVDGDTPKKIRKQILTDFRAGNIKVLCNVDLFGEGLDVPGVIVAILARPTGSLGLHRQQIGRVLRFQPGKTAYILDHAGNLARHGLPDDEIKWSLEGRAVPTKSEMESRLVIRSCPSCFAVSPASSKICESCGKELPKTPREIKQIEGELKEIEKLRQVRERKAENRSAKSEAQLVELAKLRGYKNPHGWAAVQIRLRTNKGRL